MSYVIGSAYASAKQEIVLTPSNQHPVEPLCPCRRLGERLTPTAVFKQYIPTAVRSHRHELRWSAPFPVARTDNKCIGNTAHFGSL
ncbi:MAG: hypothetical protein KatS3mg019_0902 [Fimbriimonadales bacterium]|nr:MAG: hypothetical protein KatS3mg019_0902 [Fimbriimonadales bacterium]